VERLRVANLQLASAGSGDCVVVLQIVPRFVEDALLLDSEGLKGMRDWHVCVWSSAQEYSQVGMARYW